MRVFVTGADGFVGRVLEPRFQAAGAQILAPGPDFDIRQPARVRTALAEARPDAVVHLAAVTFVPDSIDRPAETARVNYAGTRAVLEAVRQEAPAARVLLVSSANVYGATPVGAPPFDESAPLRPGNPYAWSKAAADLLGGVYAGRGLDVLRVRPFNHTGPGRPDLFAESSFARQIAEIEAGRRPARIDVGNLDAVRDFLDVGDVVDAYWRLLDPAAPAGIYNVASGSGISLAALLDLLLARANVTPEIRVLPERWREADACVGNAARLQAVTGWKPRIPLEDTLQRLLDHWRASLAADSASGTD